MFYTYHPVDDKQKVQTLAQSMQEKGWQGGPIVKWGEMHLITGCHRYNAAHGVLEWEDKEIPTIDLEEIFAEDGKDFSLLHTQYGNPTIDEDGMFVPFVLELSTEIRAKYEIDIE